MKPKYAVMIAVVTMALLCLAAESHRPKHSVVVLQTYPSFGNYTYQGISIINASVSDGVAPIPGFNWSDPNQTNLVQYAQKLAELLDQGFEIRDIHNTGGQNNGGDQIITLVR